MKEKEQSGKIENFGGTIRNVGIVGAIIGALAHLELFAAINVLFAGGGELLRRNRQSERLRTA